MWFKSEDCKSLRIRSYSKETDKTPLKDKSIQDKTSIDQLIRLIESLPVEGEKMKSFSEDTPLLVLDFNCDSSLVSIKFYRGMIKTPATSFYSGALENETKAFELAHSLL